MGRTVRHFTGRVDLWSTELQTKIEDQLRPQLWAVVNGATRLKQQQQNAKGSLIPISIRLIIHGISIHEDLQWDPSLPVSPLEFAQELATDLNLPEEAVIAITICMLEQLYGLSMDTSPDESVPAQTAQNRGSWQLDPKDTVATMNQIVAQHRPT